MSVDTTNTTAPDAATLAIILDGAAMEAPDGVEAIFDNPPNQNGLAIAIITVTMVIATLCIFMRAYARVYLLRKVGLEESESLDLDGADMFADLI